MFAEVGLVLLLLHLGLEFSLDDLLRGGRKMLAAGGVYLALNLGGGLVLGWLLGWGSRETFVVAGAVGISSSAIVTKLLVELRRLANRETGMILGVIVVEDVFLALYLALLQPVLRGGGGTEALMLAGRAFGFLLILFLVARRGFRAVGRLVGAGDDELLTILFVGFAVLVAGIAAEIGVSDAVGALMVGFILAKTRYVDRIHRLVLPLRDAFGAVFFFAFGLTIQPGAFGDVAPAVVAAAALTVILNLLSGVAAARLHGFGLAEALNAGLTLVGRGEFSLILASLAAGAGLDDRLQPFVALYVLILAVVGPFMASRSGVVSRAVLRTGQT